MASNMEQFSELELSKEDREQIFDPPLDAPKAQNGSSTTAKIVISGIPQHAKFDDIEPLLKPYGKVEHCEAGTSKDPNTQTVHITFENHDQAQRAVSGLNGIEFDSSKLLVELSEANKQARRAQRNRSQYGAGMPGGGGGPGRQTDFPLRVLVQSEMVGAIIGRQGSTIRHITQQSRARVDVHRKDNVGSVEKAITIYGNPENCTMACKKILEVMQQEANSTNKGEICLKILAHNNLIGRIIGKSGNTIKRIMQDTDTKITVSSINDISSFNLERIITVKGTIDNMSKGESQISAKLRQSYENDLQALAPQSIMFPGLHPMAMMSTAGNGMGFTGRTGGGGGGAAGAGAGGAGGGAGGMYPGSNFPMYQPPAGGPAAAGVPPGSSEVQETTFLYIPNNAVGAIIGTKGLHIRNIIRFSGASVKIAPLEADKPQEQQTERKVTIIGTPEAQWKAQYLIFEKMREEGFVSGTDDVRLTVEIFVPSAQVGRIIGKGGQNVRELQRVTGSIIKLPEHTASTPVDEETTVHIIGPFFSVQSAQRRIRTMMQATNPPPATKRQSTQKTKDQSAVAVGGTPGAVTTASATSTSPGATVPAAGSTSPSSTPPQQQQQSSSTSA
ncbi:insulin-like growth factor 2 mRNA-binding protein 1 isoform X1 [Anopheles bellator]|uniref:insulin-like growth factor 2 mRNA-binding protein 1 isoform X1 n=1 Tax=Anopheles bellator TaxID=139047 RepID=UPI0026476435|nr:insulin-like growth factor 2 mRNA-binding protein 1 isoform X1 [Anopheles bellator]